MTAKDVFRQVRMAPEISDNAEVKYSDYQLIAALNSVLSMVYNSLATYNSTAINKLAIVELESGIGDLPADFLSMVSVTNGAGNYLEPAGKSQVIDPEHYRIIGRQIYSANSRLTLEYKSWFTDIVWDTVDDELSLPPYFGELLRKYTVLVLTGAANDKDAPIVSQVAAEVKILTAGRDLSMVVDQQFDDLSGNWAGAI